MGRDRHNCLPRAVELRHAQPSSLPPSLAYICDCSYTQRMPQPVYSEDTEVKHIMGCGDQRQTQLTLKMPHQFLEQKHWNCGDGGKGIAITRTVLRRHGRTLIKRHVRHR